MNVLRRNHVPDLGERSRALTDALAIGGSRLEPRAGERAHNTLRKVGERAALGSGYTVVALAGATGSGKSSLFNRLVGAQVARPGVRRPTTSTATAAIWGPGSAGPLLDWLGVGARHQVDQAEGPREGLVLLDLPDFDSRERSNRAEADRVLQLADVFVWVTDPQKYADAVMHEHYIKTLSARDARTIVVLNQADRLTVEQVDQTTADLRRIVAADSAATVDVLPTSAATGAGVDKLMALLTDVAQSRAAAEARMNSDVRGSATALREGVGESEQHLDEQADDRLIDALAKAAGVPVVLDAVQRDYRVQANSRAGWPFTKWTRKLRPDPLRRLGLDRSSGAEPSPGVDDVRVALGRSSLPAASPAQRSAVDLATRDLADRAAEGLPLRWAQDVERAAVPDHSGLADSLDQAVMGTSLRMRRPIWWTVVAVFQWLFALAAVAGLLWLLTMIVLGWLQIHIETPAWGPIPYPTLLLAGGLLLGLLTTALMKMFASVGARRRRERVRAQLHEAIGSTARKHIMAPVRRILAEHQRTRELLDLAAR
ncbi:GTPase [Blastococcus sp. Marseille-P5729]|uniref:GTPase n=1 Tax=Blastococcus sp. Marseille-P5729 TaxID=2086582 RepID=UPI0018FE97BA|nr:GTPase [Blastococcus sp. Marseille-P5729]